MERGVIGSFSSNTQIRPDSDFNSFWLSDEQLSDIDDLSTLWTLWHGKCVDGGLPARRDFSPHDLKPVLSHIALLEYQVEAGQIRDVIVTLVGTGLTPVYGEVTGKSINQMDKMVSARVWESARMAWELRKPVGRYSRVLSEGRPYMSLISLFCPLAGNHQDIDKIILQVAFRQHRDSEFSDQFPA